MRPRRRAMRCLLTCSAGAMHENISLMVERRVVGDRFELGERSASGSMGSVYRARDLTTGEAVAVKLVTLQGHAERERFAREAELLARVHHPHVVSYIAHGSVGDDVQFLAQQWIEGPTLRRHLNGVGATVAETIQISHGLAGALAAAHRAGVVHRDVKPENVILADGNPSAAKLVDFGIARVAHLATHLTMTGIAVGTPAYMAPEQVRGERIVGPQCDVWALGCIMYEALAGRPPFGGSTSTAILTKVVIDREPDLDGFCPEAPAELVHLVKRMLHKDADQRPTDGTEVAAVLDHLVVTDSGRRRPVGKLSMTFTIGTPNAPVARGEAIRVLVFVTFVQSPASAAGDPFTAVERAAASHDLEVINILDGTALLASRIPGAEGAVGAARAAIEIKASASNAVVCVVAQTKDCPLADAIDRGAHILERAELANMFSGIIAADSRVPVDPTIARLVGDEFLVVATGDGLVLDGTRTNNRAAPSP